MQCLSNRPLKQLTVGAVTISVGKLFQTFTIQIPKKCCRSYNFVSSISNCGLECSCFQFCEEEVALNNQRHILQFYNQMFNVSTLLLDDALKLATPLINGMINEMLRQFVPLSDNSQGRP